MLFLPYWQPPSSGNATLDRKSVFDARYFERSYVPRSITPDKAVLTTGTCLIIASTLAHDLAEIAATISATGPAMVAQSARLSPANPLRSGLFSQPSPPGQAPAADLTP